MTVVDPWVKIRQVVLGSEDLGATSSKLRSALALAPGFADPILADIGLADETIAVGPEAYLEIVAALRDDVSMARWITRGGGGGGYALSIQVPDLTPLLAAAAIAGVRVVADLEVYGHRIVQLHPGDMGLLIELDEIPDRSQWFWDDVEKQVPEAPLVDDVLGVEISSPDPGAQSVLWGIVFGVPVGDSGDPGAPQLVLGARTVRFVQGERSFLSGVDLAVVDLAVGGPAAPTTLRIDGVTLNLLAGSTARAASS